MTSAPPPAPPVEPPAAEPPPPDVPVRGPLRRSGTDKMVGGVSGGLAEYSGIDPLLWRVGFVALAFAGGSGVLVYLLLWLLMPSGSVAAGRRDRALERRQAAGPRSPVPGMTLAGVLIVVGALVLVTRFTAWDISPVRFFAAALLVVGLGLVAAAFSRGRRARGGLIALGTLLSLATIAATTAPWNYGGGVGERSYRPAVADDVRPLYELGAGDLTVDLSDVDLSDVDSPIRTRIDHGVGDLDVVVPRSADVVLRVDQGIGDVRVFDGEGDLDSLQPGRGAAWSDDGQAEFVITIESGVGDVEVSRA
jgi:phage shock protein PspC (stress-responsive transcriptional regulator)